MLRFATAMPVRGALRRFASASRTTLGRNAQRVGQRLTVKHPVTTPSVFAARSAAFATGPQVRRLSTLLTSSSIRKVPNPTSASRVAVRLMSSRQIGTGSARRRARKWVFWAFTAAAMVFAAPVIIAGGLFMYGNRLLDSKVPLSDEGEERVRRHFEMFEELCFEDSASSKDSFRTWLQGFKLTWVALLYGLEHADEVRTAIEVMRIDNCEDPDPNMVFPQKPSFSRIRNLEVRESIRKSELRTLVPASASEGFSRSTSTSSNNHFSTSDADIWVSDNQWKEVGKETAFHADVDGSAAAKESPTSDPSLYDFGVQGLAMLTQFFDICLSAKRGISETKSRAFRAGNGPQGWSDSANQLSNDDEVSVESWLVGAIHTAAVVAVITAEHKSTSPHVCLYYCSYGSNFWVPPVPRAELDDNRRLDLLFKGMDVAHDGSLSRESLSRWMSLLASANRLVAIAEDEGEKRSKHSARRDAKPPPAVNDVVDKWLLRSGSASISRADMDISMIEDLRDLAGATVDMKVALDKRKRKSRRERRHDRWSENPGERHKQWHERRAERRRKGRDSDNSGAPQQLEERILISSGDDLREEKFNDDFVNDPYGDDTRDRK